MGIVYVFSVGFLRIKHYGKHIIVVFSFSSHSFTSGTFKIKYNVCPTK